MPAKAKAVASAAKAKPKTAKSRADAVVDVVSDSDVEEVPKVKKPRKRRGARADAAAKALETIASNSVPWSAPAWDCLTHKMIALLQEDPDLRVQLFSDSTKAAKADSREVVTNKSTKLLLYEQVAQHIFHDEPLFADRWKTDEGRKALGVSVMGRFTK